MRRALLLVMAAGCRQLFGLDPPIARGDADVDVNIPDGPRDAQGGSCIERWIMGPQLAAPISMSLNSATQDRLPFVTADGMQLYYVHDNDIYRSSAFGGVFPMGTREDQLSSGNGEGRVTVAANGTRAFFSSNRAGGTGGGADLWRASRADVVSPWALDQLYLDNLNKPGDQSNPYLTDDLLHIYYAQKGVGIMYAQRAAAVDLFGTPTLLAGVNGLLGEDDMPTLTADERVIVFASTRTGNSELWYATRDVGAPGFTAPKLVPGVNNPNRDDEGPYLTPDGCTLYFGSDRNGGQLDIYVATLLD
ncbi:MAG TPA: hypothetical protein VIV40_33880 [Kofleriaceae bacterium]